MNIIVLLAELRFSVDLKSLTLEQADAKRHKLLKDMAADMALEVRMYSAPLVCAAGYAQRKILFYNDSLADMSKLVEVGVLALHVRLSFLLAG
eukprot:6183728-Pleurochrysis_carterae.AAC.4